MFDGNDQETEIFLIIHYLLKLIIDRNVHIQHFSISKIYCFEIKLKSVTILSWYCLCHNFDKSVSQLINTTYLNT